MDARRRAGSFNRAVSGTFAPGAGAASASGLRPSRPSSAPRVPGSRLDLSGSHGHGWGKDRPSRHFSSGASGLARQASAPTLAANARTSGHGVGYDSFAKSPGLRRSSSATALGHRSVPGLRYEASSSYATPEREFGGGRAGHGVGAAFPQRADALHLESRLTERLREHSLSGTEGATRRPGSRSRPGSSLWPNQSWQEDSFGQHSGYQPAHTRFSSHISHYNHRSPDLEPSGGQYMPPSASLSSMSPQMEAVGSRGQRWPLPGHREDSYPERSSVLTPPHHRTDLSMTGLTDSGSMPESRLKIYSDLFEEVIERDRVFGSLLRKIKTAYDMMLRQPAVPPLPMDGVSTHMSHHDIDQHGWAGQDSRAPPHSNEPTTRAEGGQAWEMQRENRVLKDLVERLHLELEEAVRREHRWKQKVTKLKAKAETAEMRPMASQAHGFSMNLDDSRSQLGHLQKMPSDYLVQHNGHLQRDEQVYISDPNKMVANTSVPRFHASRREPTLGEVEAQEGPLNQGGLLSISSISPQNSMPPFPMDMMNNEGGESARSTDNDMLPQRAPFFGRERPDYVPKLDFSRLKDQLEEDEEEEEMEGEGQEDDRGSDYGEMQAHGKIAHYDDQMVYAEDHMGHGVHGRHMVGYEVGDGDRTPGSEEYLEGIPDEVAMKLMMRSGSDSN